MRIAVLVKQIPKPEALAIRDGRLVRDGVDLEVNAYCRRANAKAVELAGDTGEVVVFTMGPPSAELALREMIACGAHRGVHLCDPAFAGADTLATARALASAIFAEGPFDLVLSGLNSLDADTGQVGAQVAELLGLPFAPGARELTVSASRLRARLETDDGYREVEVDLPAAVSTAERLCDPSKADHARCADVAAHRIVRRSTTDFDLKAGEVGALGSPTSVGPIRQREISRRRVVAGDVAQAVAMLDDLGAWSDVEIPSLPVPLGGGGPAVWCFLEPDPHRPDRELLATAADLAATIGGSVTAVTPLPIPPDLSAQGADRVLVVGGDEPEQWADALAEAAGTVRPWALLVEGTRTGRALAATVAARRGWGLTGDAIDLDVSAAGRLRAWKPAFGGRLVAPIESSSPVQMATVRPGVLRGGRRRAESANVIVVDFIAAKRKAPRLRTTAIEHIDDDFARIAEARVVIGVGAGVSPAEYEALEPLQHVLGASLVATRKVTDQGWLPRSRQVGVTGRSLAPRLYVSIGASGRFNHVVGFVAAQTVLAINVDPDAEIFHHADVGLVGDWRILVPDLADALAARAPACASTRVSVD